MRTFWQLLRESIIVQSLVTMVVVCTTMYLFATGREVKTELINFGMLILGFWFGSKSVSMATPSSIQHIVRQEVQRGRQDEA